jgi:AcrR family transcriptional regulator
LNKGKEHKINEILKNSLKILAKNGFENTTIANIATESGVSRGILHYYFSDKEDLVSKVLAYSSDEIILGSIKGIRGKTPDEIIDNIIKDNIQNFKKNPDSFAFLFEMWCASRRSQRIKNELIKCSYKVTKAIKMVLDDAIKKDILKIDIKYTEEIAKALLALFNGIAFEMLLHTSRDLDNSRYWIQIKSMMLSILRTYP